MSHIPPGVLVLFTVAACLGMFWWGVRVGARLARGAILRELGQMNCSPEEAPTIQRIEHIVRLHQYVKE